ncbi:hypothetical protein ACH5RR_014403 [Cinchona calisaya]|uniref:Uncharacterized protein n=1 Tax=Cinchona calisaya TaxID=153742 RepID=A0ABD3A550_9GENT
MAEQKSNTPEFPKDSDSSNDEELQEELAFVNRRRGCCFWLPCFGSGGQSDTIWERIAMAADKEEAAGWIWDWWGKSMNALKKVRERSELVAGPKWKTFIRRFNKSKGGVKCGEKYQYDPESYALNFDEGPGQNGLFVVEDDDRLFRDFSSRYASIPVSDGQGW